MWLLCVSQAYMSARKIKYNAIPDGTPKVMARLIGKDYGDMLRYAKENCTIITIPFRIIIIVQLWSK